MNSNDLSEKAIIDYGQAGNHASSPAKLDSNILRALCLESGADEVGFANISNPAFDKERTELLKYFPPTKTLASVVCRMNREPIRNSARSTASLESHETADRVHKACHRIVAALERQGVRAVNPSVAFPTEMDNASGKGWAVSHKTVAVAAGLGRMGLHRCVIHPQFGNFILLGTVLIDAEVNEYGQPLIDDLCLGCKLCVAACPTGAISSDGYFNFSACITHNYRDFAGGFTNWVEGIADSKNAADYRRKFTDSETASVWQSLTCGGVYKCVYCLAVCPAGRDVVKQYSTDKKSYVNDVVRPLNEKQETIYVVPGSDAEDHVARRFPKKRIKRVGNGLRPRSIQVFLNSLPLVFQREKSKELNAIYHFTFTGEEELRGTVVIREGTVRTTEGHEGIADLRITADSRWWLGFLSKERKLIWGLLRGKLRLRGSAKLLAAFGRCFPS